MNYKKFIENKIVKTVNAGFNVIDQQLHQSNKPHQNDIIKWAAKGGNRAIFGSFGTGKTQMQLELMRLAITQDWDEGQFGLIICPLAVKGEFKKDAARLEMEIEYVRNDHEIENRSTKFLITNYERVRDGGINIAKHTTLIFVSLDEASVLRSYGSKTYQEFLPLFKNVSYKYVCTATPSPNRYKELIHYAGFLGIMDTGQALTRWFKRDSTKANNLTLHPHKEREFWLWVSSWAIFITKPSDLGYDDEGYDLPKLNVHWHKVQKSDKELLVDSRGQVKAFEDQVIGLSDAAKEKRLSILDRVIEADQIINGNKYAHRFGNGKSVEVEFDGIYKYPNSKTLFTLKDVHENGAVLINTETGKEHQVTDNVFIDLELQEKHWLLWHHLESERQLIESNIPDVVSVYGSQDEQVKENLLQGFANGDYKILATKPSIAGQGCNFQYHCSDAIFLGINYEFNDFIQAVHRIHRYQQKNDVNIHIIYTEAEEHIRTQLEAKWKRHDELVENMISIIKEYGLSNTGAIGELKRSIGVERQEVKGAHFTYVNNDSVEEWKNIKENRFGMILTSIPFSNHYEYTPSYNDFGHTNNDDHFFVQMDYLTPNLYKSLQPGRVCVVHVKDRINFGNVTGLGRPTVNPFHMKTAFHFMSHGFKYFGMITVETDVVRENNQTYRLGWSEKCKDGTKMGVGSPEYLLLFFKPQSDLSKGYADVPVIHNKDSQAVCPSCNEKSNFMHWEEMVTAEEDIDLDAMGGWEYKCPKCGVQSLLEDIATDFGYSRGNWQIDARAKWNSSGNSLLTPEEIGRLDLEVLNQKFKSFFSDHIYNYDTHVTTANAMDKQGRLPKKFETLKVAARTDAVWSDIVRMRTLNSNQSQRNQEQHICPFQLDIVQRCIELWSNPDDEVADCFGGIGSVGYEAIKMGRKAFLCELNGYYWKHGVRYCRESEYKANVPTLFDVTEFEKTA